MKAWLVFWIAQASLASAAMAADITHAKLDDETELIGIEGDIEAGDEEKFRRLAVQYDRAIVVLASDGGLLLPALEIGKAIHLKDFATFVPDDKNCASSCALIWVAGGQRWLGPTGKVGFHASYLESNGKQLETGVGNALVGRYLTQLDLPERSIIFATSAPPNSIRWLRASDMGSSGIDFKILKRDAEVTTPPPPIILEPRTAQKTAPGGWRLAAISEGYRTVYFVNTDEIIRAESSVRFWADSWWNTTTDGANRSVTYMEANCANKSYRDLQTSYYLNDRYVTKSTRLTTLEYATPGSMISGVIRAVCDSDYYPNQIDDRLAAVARLRAKR